MPANPTSEESLCLLRLLASGARASGLRRLLDSHGSAAAALAAGPRDWASHGLDADALGQSLTTQTATSATELLVSNDILSLNVLLNNLTKNPLVAHAAIYSVDNRILAEAGSRPKQGLLGETEGLYSTPITFQEVIAGHLRISLDTEQFQQPMTISLQSMGILTGMPAWAALLLAILAAMILSGALGVAVERVARSWSAEPM